jgi:uncharacterized tellurite resistance protein B-like protein
MFDSIRNFFTSSMMPGDADGDPEGGRGREGEGGQAAPAARAAGPNRDIRLAACALLLELAFADDHFSDEERTHLEGAVRRHFGLDHAQAEELIRHANSERMRAADLWQFTNLIREHYSLGQKMVLAEIMWGLVFSDGELSAHEDYLLRKVSKLLDLEMAYLSEARRRAESGLDDALPGVD